MADLTAYTTSGIIRIRRGPRGPAGATGPAGAAGADGASGSGTIANTGNLIQGDGAGAGIDSTIVPADVILLLANNTGTNTGDQTDISGNAESVTAIPSLSGDVSSSANEVTLVNVPKEATFENDPTAIPLNTGGWSDYRVASNEATTGQTLVDIPGLISGTLANAARYEFEATLLFTTSSDATGFKIGIHAAGSGSAATAFGIVTGTSGGPNTAAAYTLKDVDAASPVSLATSADVTAAVRITGFVTTRSSGTATISIQHLKVTSGTSTCLAGSIMRLRRSA